MAEATDLFRELLAIMGRLRSPGGCPWDREQTLSSLRRYLVEETYEVLDAIDREDWDGLAEELGDLQLQIVFQAEIARSEGLFDISAVLDSINRKLVRRHPHVFDTESLASAADVERRWDQIKQAEKPRGGSGLLEAVPASQPAVLEAEEVGKIAARTGFDWQSFEDLRDKLDEEFSELAEARRSGVSDRIEDEVGDLLFMVVNVARYAGVNPELALKRANRKFRARFGAMERELAASGQEAADCTPEKWEELWERAKQA